MNNNTDFNVKSTLMIKGIAIILMVSNHLYPIPEWITPENQYFSLTVGSKTIAAYFGGFSKICVAIFAILTGIGMYFAYRKTLGGYKHTIKKLPRFLVTYWTILFIIYIPIMQAVGVYRFGFMEFILNLFGYKTTYCKIAWYVRFYIELVLTFSFWVWLYNMLKRKLASQSYLPFVIIIIIQWFIGFAFKHYFPNEVYVNEYFNYLPIVMFGYLIGEMAIFSKSAEFMNKKEIKLQVILSITIILACFLGRGAIKYVAGFNMDFLYAPLFIYSIWRLVCLSRFNRALTFTLELLGKYSLEIWFLHAIFFIGSPMIQRIGYWPKIDILILIWVLTLLLPFSLLIQEIVKKILATNCLKTS